MATMPPVRASKAAAAGTTIGISLVGGFHEPLRQRRSIRLIALTVAWEMMDAHKDFVDQYCTPKMMPAKMANAQVDCL